MKNQNLEEELTKALKKSKKLFTRLRTPNYGFRGVRYPGDFVVWAEKGTYLIECKQRKSLPLAPSDIRQMPFMEEWEGAGYDANASYYILTKVDSGYYLFTAEQAVRAKETHKGLKADWTAFHSTKIEEIVEFLV